MVQAPDPFAHQPELRDRITDPLQSFFRTFKIENMVDTLVERNLPIGWWHSDAVREATRHKALECLGNDDLWIFAYGSLMWDPAFVFTEVHKCHAPGFSRQFILVEKNGGRGSPEKPGLIAALDKGAGCEGLAFRIANPIVNTETEILWRREMVAPGYVPTFIEIMLGDERIKAITFVADHDADAIDPSLTLEQQAQMIATASGILGTNLEYLENIAKNFEILGVHDQYITELMHWTGAYIKTHGTSSI